MQKYLDNLTARKGYKHHKVLLTGSLTSEDLEKPSIYIIFHDEHYYSLYITSNPLGQTTFIAFDRLGKDPRESYGLKLPETNNYEFNDIQIQPFSSSLCAVYCLYFVDQITKGATLKQLLRHFTRSNLSLNDKKVCEYYRALQKANKVNYFAYCEE